MKRIIVSFAALLILLSVGATARADLITNGSFETGDLTGWTDGGNLGWNSVTTVPAPGEGTFGVSNGAVGSLSLLSQTLATTPGGLYQIDFWIANDGAGIFNVLFDGATVYSEAGISHPYAMHSVFATASTASTVIQTQSRDDPGFIRFDGIHVNQVEAVPEPASLTLLGVSAASLLGGYAWRRRKRATTT